MNTTTTDAALTPVPVPPPIPAPPIILQPGVPITLQATVNGITIQATVIFSVSPSGGVNFTVDSKTVTADSGSPV